MIYLRFVSEGGRHNQDSHVPGINGSVHITSHIRNLDNGAKGVATCTRPIFPRLTGANHTGSLARSSPPVPRGALCFCGGAVLVVVEKARGGRGQRVGLTTVLTVARWWAGHPGPECG